MSGATRRPAFRRTRRSLAGCALRDRGVWESICHHLVMADRERTGREAGPTAAVIDSQSAKTTEAGGPRGRDSGKTVRAASATPWSTPMAARWSCSATLPACRTATAPSLSCAPPPPECVRARLSAWPRGDHQPSRRHGGAEKISALALCASASSPAATPSPSPTTHTPGAAMHRLRGGGNIAAETRQQPRQAPGTRGHRIAGIRVAAACYGQPASRRAVASWLQRN